ncbi:helix-turn-helix domain-containing protein [Parabacteroides faecis]|uniref:helix-turn-helix domain-containing protein n=1 Tax=Parabacteroides faecis TaxID=1217282 RepID=UPI003520222C
MFLDNIPVHNLDETDFFVVERIENCAPLNFQGSHRHNFYELQFFTETGTNESHSIDFVEYPLQANQLYLLRPGQVHTLKLKDQKGFLFAINPDYFERLCLHIERYADHTFPNMLLLPEKEIFAVRQIVHLIYCEHEELHRKSLLNSYMHALITHLLLLYTDTRIDQDIRVGKVLSLIDKHYINERTTDFYAREVNLSNKRMNELIKKAVGHTVKQLIDQRLLLEAKRMISSGASSFKEIAFSLGFSEASYFTRFFKEQSGCTPEQFRSLLKKDLS